MFYQSLCAGDWQRAFFILSSQMNNLGMTVELDPRETKLHVQHLACTVLQLNIPQWDILCWI